MSKNFEILQRAGKTQSLFRTVQDALPRTSARPAASEPGKPRPANTELRRMRFDLEGPSREQTIRLVHSVFLANGIESPRAVVFSGIDRGVGSTWNCACAARALAAHVSGRVCAVDANLRHPSLHRHFGLNNTNGLVAALAGKSSAANFANQVDGTNLWVLPSGTESSDPSRICTPTEMDARLSDLKSQFDYVLIDSPAVNRYGDAFGLGQMCDGIVLIVQSSTTQRAAARRAKVNADALHVRVLGVVLNRYIQEIPELVSRVLK